jgi:hypothetical protein
MGDRVAFRRLLRQQIIRRTLDSFIQPPWGTPCDRLEGGAYANPQNEYKDTCKVEGAISGGNMFVVNRTYVVDEELQTGDNFFYRSISELSTSNFNRTEYWQHTGGKADDECSCQLSSHM